jgi:hypothetical protein
MTVYPRLQFESPAELAPVRARLEAIDTQRWDDITSLVGLTDAGDPIRIVLEAEDSDLAHRVPSWIAGFAAQPSETVRYISETFAYLPR